MYSFHCAFCSCLHIQYSFYFQHYTLPMALTFHTFSTPSCNTYIIFVHKTQRFHPHNMPKLNSSKPYLKPYIVKNNTCQIITNRVHHHQVYLFHQTQQISMIFRGQLLTSLTVFNNAITSSCTQQMLLHS